MSFDFDAAISIHRKSLSLFNLTGKAGCLFPLPKSKNIGAILSNRIILDDYDHLKTTFSQKVSISENIHNVVVSPDEKVLAIIYKDSSRIDFVSLEKTDKKQPFFTYKFEANIETAAFAPDSSCIDIYLKGNKRMGFSMKRIQNKETVKNQPESSTPEIDFIRSFLFEVVSKEEIFEAILAEFSKNGKKEKMELCLQALKKIKPQKSHEERVDLAERAKKAKKIGQAKKIAEQINRNSIDKGASITELSL